MTWIGAGLAVIYVVAGDLVVAYTLMLAAAVTNRWITADVPAMGFAPSWLMGTLLLAAGLLLWLIAYLAKAALSWQ